TREWCARINNGCGAEPEPLVDLVFVAQLRGRKYADLVTAVCPFLDLVCRPKCIGMIGLGHLVDVRPFELGLGLCRSNQDNCSGYDREILRQMARPVRHCLPRAALFKSRLLARMLLLRRFGATAQLPLAAFLAFVSIGVLLWAQRHEASSTMSTPRTIRLSPEDNVVVAVDQIPSGVTAAGVVARERVPRGHKMAVAGIREGEPVRKYGQTIGFASKAITPGEWVHEQNVGLRDFA